MIDLKKEYQNLLHPAQSNVKAMGKVKSFFSNPLSQYFIFALIMVLLAIVSTTGSSGFITRSFVMAIGNTLIYAIVAIGFCLLLGYSGLASLGTAGFIGLGAYTAYYVIESYGLPYIVALAATLLVSIVIGVAVGFISLRIEGIYLAILTLGLSEILRNLLMAIKGSIKINLKNITLFGARIDETAVFMMILALFLILMYLTYNLIKSPTGRAMLAMKNSTSAAQAMGISLMKYRLLASLSRRSLPPSAG